MGKIRVPDGMLKAFEETYRTEYGCLPHSVHMQKIIRSFEAALAWLVENPIVPSWKQIGAMIDGFVKDIPSASIAEIERHICSEWQRRMFLEPEPEVPEELKDLLIAFDPDLMFGKLAYEAITEAYRRGQKAGKP